MHFFYGFSVIYRKLYGIPVIKRIDVEVAT